MTLFLLTAVTDGNTENYRDSPLVTPHVIVFTSKFVSGVATVHTITGGVTKVESPEFSVLPPVTAVKRSKVKGQEARIIKVRGQA